MGLRNQVIDKIYVIFIYDFLVTLRDNKCKKGVLVPQKFIGRFFLWFFSIKIWGMWQKVFLSLSIIMIRYVVSHDFSGLGQETKILYIPMTLHTYLMTWSWMKNLLMRVWPSNTKETKKTKEFYVANYDPLYPFPLWISATLEILFSFPWHDMSKIEVVKRSCE